MSPKAKSRNIKTRSTRKKSLTNAVKSPAEKTPVKTKSKRRSALKTPKNKKGVEPTPSASSTNDSCNASTEEKNNSKNEDHSITPKVMKYCLNAYKHSPDYGDLRKKRFNTSFRYERRQGYRDIKIFSPEEEDSPKWSENLPPVENKIQGEPGAKYADIFMSIPGISDSDEELKEIKLEETTTKSRGKKGRKKSIGYKGLPLPDECLLTDYTSLLQSSD